MKGLLNVLLLILVLVQAFSKWIIVADFEANREYIARTLCENRQRPQMRCGGKCQLAKRLAEEGKGTSQRTLRISFDEVTLSRTTPLAPPALIQEISGRPASRFLLQLPRPFLPSLRKPPCVATSCA
ncbi:MAG: hypothetical protein EOO08_01230 [Chitinophagaceae bacterium]|nr:MAG: hypothetical protein EOO08_01230 [Chitinophagaceae bacterium]